MTQRAPRLSEAEVRTARRLITCPKDLLVAELVPQPSASALPHRYEHCQNTVLWWLGDTPVDILTHWLRRHNQWGCLIRSGLQYLLYAVCCGL